MRFAPELSGPRRPLESTPAMVPGSVRRTTTIDVVRPDGPLGPPLIDARGRDVSVDAPGVVAETGTARLAIALGADRTVSWIESVPEAGARGAGIDLDALVGAPVAVGFRRLVAEATGADAARGGLWHLLLDDLVGAVLVGGVAQQYDELDAGGGPMHDGIYANLDAMFESQAGICAGWARDASMLTEVRRDGVLPVPVGPAAPDLDGGGGWHEVEPLAAHSVRRRRRLDVGPVGADGLAPVDGHFRDSHVDGDHVERCLHEYTIAGHFDVAGGVLTALTADARVLPWLECPAAVASASRAVGVPLDELRDWARAELRGVSTCTHLNDVVRSLADLSYLS